MNSSRWVKFFTAVFGMTRKQSLLRSMKLLKQSLNAKGFLGMLMLLCTGVNRAYFSNVNWAKGIVGLVQVLEFSRSLCGELVRIDLSLLRGVVTQLESSTENSV